MKKKIVIKSWGFTLIAIVKPFFLNLYYITVLGDDIPTMEQAAKCNGIRPIKKENNVFNRNLQLQPPPQSLQRSPSYRNSVIRDNLAGMGPSASATLRGHSIGFGNRDAGSLRSPTHKGRKTVSMMVPQGHGSDRHRRKYCPVIWLYILCVTYKPWKKPWFLKAKTETQNCKNRENRDFPPKLKMKKKG